MNSFAMRLASSHVISNGSSVESFPLFKLKEDFKVISKAFDVLNESISFGVPIPPSGEWLLDNFYLIEEQFSVVCNELSLNEYLKLPSVNGVSRIFLIASEMVSFSDAAISEKFVEEFVSSYQSRKSISMSELLLLPLMLRAAIVFYVRGVADKIIVSQFQKFKVESLFERLVIKAESQRFSKYRFVSAGIDSTAYVEHLIFLLKGMGREGLPFLNALYEELFRAGTTAQDVIRHEHFDLALSRVSMANSITSIRNIVRFDFQSIFENVNSIESILKKDFWYDSLDLETRNEYREVIRDIATKLKVSEVYVATKLIELAGEDEHIGAFLIGDKKDLLYEKLRTQGAV